MGNIENVDRWYALFVLTGQEEKVREKLKYRFKNKEMNFIIPRRKLRERKAGKWEEKVKSLFPGYILINGYIGVKEYYLMEGIPGLLRVLKDNDDPFEIPEEEITVIKKLICNGEVIEQSSAFAESGKIKIVDGPLLGLEGLITSIDKRKGRAKVRLNFAGEPRLIDLGIDIIQPV